MKIVDNLVPASFILASILVTTQGFLNAALTYKLIILGVTIYFIFISVIDLIVIKKKFMKDSWVDFQQEIRYFTSSILLLVAVLLTGLVGMDLSFALLILPALTSFLQMTHFIAKHLNSF